MEFVFEHINKYLDAVVLKKCDEFDRIFSLLNSSSKERIKPLLKYLNEILLFSERNESDKLDFVHIHFPQINESFTSAILEWFIIREFYGHFRDSKNYDQESISFVDKQVANLDTIINDPTIPSNASAKNGGNKALKNHRERKKRLRKVKDFYQSLSANKLGNSFEFKPTTLINLLRKEYEYQEANFFESSWYVMTPDNITESSRLIRRAYVLLNDVHDLSQIDQLKLNNQSLLDNIVNVLLFDCATKSRFSSFNYRNLVKFNEEGTHLNKLYIFSFEKTKFNLEKVLSKLNLINTKFYIRPSGLEYKSYVIHHYELQRLIADPVQPPEIVFIGDTSFFCYELCELLQDLPELKELYSIKMRNMYSLCWTKEITSLVLDDIFDPSIDPVFISKSTKDLVIKQTIIVKLRDQLRSILEVVQSIGSRFISKCSKKNKSTILIPYHVYKHSNLFEQLKALINNPTISYTTWKEVKNTDFSDLVVLDYRDSGDFPFNIYPNIYELFYSTRFKITGFFLAMFFKGNYEFTLNNYLKTFFAQILNHSFREEQFNWEEIKLKMELSSTRNDDYTNLWDIENVYEHNQDHNSIEFTFKNRQKRKYYPSHLLIFSEDYKIKHVYSAENIYDHYDDKTVYIQPLEMAYEDIHLFDFTKEEQEELNQIKAKYDLNPTEEQTELWKVFLCRKALENDIDSVYSELLSIATENNIKFISKNYFQDNWLNYDSRTLIPRSKKLFKFICEYLQLPYVYFRLMLKQRAKERYKARQSNSQMNTFLMTLINFGLFNDGVEFDPSNDDHRLLTENLIKNHDLEEIGIIKENIYKELTALIALIKDNIKLELVESIKRNAS